jgi:WD40 repeat protein
LVWDVQPHRGIQSLHGLDTQIARSKVVFTRDGNRIAALSLGWQAAVWDLPSGSLRYRFDVTPGLTADNAGLAFSPDGSKFAVSVGSEARLWDLEAHTETAWQLPEGLVDTLAFDETGTRLFLIRMETADWIHPPDNRSSVQDHPRVCRVRDLLASPERDFRRQGKGNPAWQTDFFNQRIVIAQASPDGRYLMVTGDHGDGGTKSRRLVKVYEIATGKELLSFPGVGDHLDPTGRIMQFSPESLSGTAQYTLIEVPSGKWIASINPPPNALGREAQMTAVQTANRFGLALYRAGERNPLVTLGIDMLSVQESATFSGDGARLAWGNQDGTVTVCNLPEIQRRMAALGFGW